MSDRKFDYAVVIGRFQPFHNGHKHLIDEAFNVADKVIVLLGSANRPRNFNKNPFTAEERMGMISSVYPKQVSGPNLSLLFGFVSDRMYNDSAWTKNVQDEVNFILENELIPPKEQYTRGCLVGYKKDASSVYLDMFPQWEQVNVKPTTPMLDATPIRNQYLMDGADSHAVKSKVPPEVLKFLDYFEDTKEFDELQEAYKFNIKYRQQFENYPYPNALTFTTTDAVVFCSGHVLVVTRKEYPGKGLLALPGGFLAPGQRLFDNCLKELFEETSIDLPRKVLVGSLVDQCVFDHPERSSRGRTITNSYAFHLLTGPLPKVKGGDDAASSQWITLSEAASRENEFFEDHYDQIEYFAGRLK